MLKLECCNCGEEFEVSPLVAAEKWGIGPAAENANPERISGPFCPECEEVA